MIYVKFHEGVVAICDCDLIGKTFADGKTEIKVSEYFYKGEERNNGDVREIMLENDNLNILGKESVRVAIDAGIVEEEDVIFIKGVPHAQAISL